MQEKSRNKQKYVQMDTILRIKVAWLDAAQVEHDDQLGLDHEVSTNGESVSRPNSSAASHYCLTETLLMIEFA